MWKKQRHFSDLLSLLGTRYSFFDSDATLCLRKNEGLRWEGLGVNAGGYDDVIP